MKQAAAKVTLNCAVALIAVMAFGVRSADASSISIAFDSVAFNGTDYTYTYSLATGADTFKTTTTAVLGGPAGTFYTLYDFSGYVAGSADVSGLSGSLGTSTNWSITTQLTGKTPGGTTPVPADHIARDNVVFTWIGADTALIAGAKGTFTLKSTQGSSPLDLIAWSGQDTSTASGNTDRSGGAFQGPAVPDSGSTVALLGLGLLTVAMFGRKFLV